MKTERPITGSVQEKNGKLYYVINEYEGKKRRQDWVYSGYPARGNKKKAEAGLQKELCKRNEQKNKPSRLKGRKRRHAVYKLYADVAQRPKRTASQQLHTRL